jgi:transcriptional regulator with XRE-family HTH domain
MAKPLVDDLDRHIGRRLKKLRQREKVSALALAGAIESTQQQISRYENAHNKLSAAQLYRIATALSVPTSWFFQDYQPPAPTPVLTARAPQQQSEHMRDELNVLADLWPRLNPEQRAAVLRVIDAFLV